MTLSNLESVLNHEFKDKDLLTHALTHRSFSYENSVPNNERLEFIGDSILGMIIATELFQQFPFKNEGDLTKLRSALVSRESLSVVALKINLNSYLKLGAGQRSNATINADTLEALIAALYLDGGFEITRAFVLKHIFNTKTEFIDYKSTLQEKLQSLGRSPRYVLLDQYGPDHKKVFTVKCETTSIEWFLGFGPSIKLAEQNAAKQALESLTF